MVWVQPYSFSSKDKRTKKQVTEALIMSTIDFCIEIWGENSDVQHRVQVALNGVLREYLGYKDRQDAHVKDLLEEAGWLNVPNRWRQALIKAMDRIMEHKFPEPIWNLIETTPVHRYETRNTDLKIHWTPRNETVSKAMFWQAKTIINETKYNQMTVEGMSKADHRDFIKRMLIGHYGNTNC